MAPVCLGALAWKTCSKSLGNTWRGGLWGLRGPCTKYAADGPGEGSAGSGRCSLRDRGGDSGHNNTTQTNKRDSPRFPEGCCSVIIDEC